MITLSVYDYFNQNCHPELKISNNDLLNALEGDSILLSNNKYKLFMLNMSDINCLLKLNLISGEFLEKLCYTRPYLGSQTIENYFDSKLNFILDEQFLRIPLNFSIINYIDYNKICPHIINYKLFFNKLIGAIFLISIILLT